ncbi:MAG: biopolymer transporter ExbD [bacterium]|nr:biopolymer transporter ExbD [bacterium]
MSLIGDSGRTFGRRRERLEIAITPLIDIVFLLLIFFMLTSRFVVQEGIDVDLPVTKQVHPLSGKEVHLVFLSEEGSVFFDGRFMALDELSRVLSRRGEGWLAKPFEVRSDRQTPVQALVRVLEVLRDGGARQVTIGTHHELPQPQP